MKQPLLLVLLSTTIFSMELEISESIKQTALPIEISEGQKWNSYYIPATNIAISTENQNLDDYSENTFSTFSVFNIHKEEPVYTHDFEGTVRPGRKSFLLNNTIYQTKNSLNFQVAKNEYIIATNPTGKYMASLQFKNGKQFILFYEKNNDNNYIQIQEKKLSEVTKIVTPKNSQYPAEQELLVAKAYNKYKAVILDSLNSTFLDTNLSLNEKTLQYCNSNNTLTTFINYTNPHFGWAICSPESENTAEWVTHLGAETWGVWCIFDDNEHVLTSYFPDIQNSNRQIAFGIKNTKTNGLIEIEGLNEINEFFKDSRPSDSFNFFERKRENVCVLNGKDKAIVRICYPFIFSDEESLETTKEGSLSNVIAYFLVDLTEKTTTILQLQKDYMIDKRDNFIVKSLQKYTINNEQEVIFCVTPNADKTVFYYTEIDLTDHAPINWHEAGRINFIHPEPYLKNDRVQYYTEDLENNITILQPNTGLRTDIPLGYFRLIQDCFEFAYFFYNNRAVVIHENDNSTYTISIYNAPDKCIEEIPCHDYNFTIDPVSKYFIHLLTSNPRERVQVFHIAERNSEEIDTTEIKEPVDNYSYCSIQ